VPRLQARGWRTLGQTAALLPALLLSAPGVLAQAVVQPVALPTAFPAPQAGSAMQTTAVPSALTAASASSAVVLYAPNLTRPDVAEALRKAMLGQGTQVYLITTRAGLYNAGGIPFHLALAGATVYLIKAPADSLPFLVTDGATAEGPAVQQPGGGAVLTSNARAAQLRLWSQSVTRSVKPVALEEIVHTWISTVLHLQTK